MIPAHDGHLAGDGGDHFLRRAAVEAGEGEPGVEMG